MTNTMNSTIKTVTFLLAILAGILTIQTTPVAAIISWVTGILVLAFWKWKP